MLAKSLYAKSNLPIGHQVTKKDVAIKKPGIGIPANNFKKIIGKKLKQAISIDEPYTEDHF